MVERIDAYGGLLFETGRTRLSQLSNKVLLHSTSLVLYPPTTLAPELLSSNNPTNHRGVCMCSAGAYTYLLWREYARNRTLVARDRCVAFLLLSCVAAALLCCSIACCFSR
jgi:hypothetical protein